MTDKLDDPERLAYAGRIREQLVDMAMAANHGVAGLSSQQCTCTLVPELLMVAAKLLAPFDAESQATTLDSFIAMLCEQRAKFEVGMALAAIDAMGKPQ